jgi:hypothetical protein
LTFTYTGLVNGDGSASFTGGLTTTATSSSSVGTYPITEGSLAATANYTIGTFNQGTLTINPAVLTVTASNKSMTYGGSVPALTYTYTGLVNGDSSASFTGALTTTASSSSDVGSYAITKGSLAATGNYTIGTFNQGTLAVTPYSFTYQIANDSQTYGIAANLAHDLGTTINTGVNGQNLDITYSSTGDTATAAVGTYPITGTLSDGIGKLSNYDVTLLPGTLTVTMGVGSGVSNVILLSPTASGALTLSGNAQLTVTGVVEVDSSSSSALTATGNATISASNINVVGNTQVSGNVHFTPSPVTGASPVADPLINLPVPNVSGTATSVNLSGHDTLTINPGIYSQIKVSGNAVLTMNSGVYVIAGGGFSVSGNGIVNGSGVMIYNGGSNYANGVDGGTYGALTFSGNTQLNLTPLTTGTYANVLIFQGRQNTKSISFSGNADPSEASIIYAPAAAVTLSGNGQVGSATFKATVIASTMNLNGNAIFQLSDPGNGNTAFGPDQIRTAYGVNALSLDGTGQTIAIVDAFDNPSIYQSVDAFDNQFGMTAYGLSLFQQYGPASAFLTVLNQDGEMGNLPITDPSGAGAVNWESEEALDVEWTHAMAPGARIILVEASSQSLPDLMAAVATAAAQPGVSVVSMSWGFPESYADLASAEAQYDRYFTTPAGHQGVTFVASTGDYGSAVPEYPAFSPNVVAIGGTSLALNSDGSYNSETGWGYYSNAVGQFLGSGGGVSQHEGEPAYQQGVQSTGSRTIPDVSFVADPNTGVWLADTYNLSGDSPWEVAGGTSLSAPAWAGLIALVDQGREAAAEQTLGSTGSMEAQTALYNLPQSDYNVIASGSNGDFTAQPGYNLVTGLGTPVANQLVTDLIAWSGAVNTSGNTVPAWQGSSNYQRGDSGNNSGEVESIMAAMVFHVFDFESMASAGGNTIHTGANSTPNAAGLDSSLIAQDTRPAPALPSVLASDRQSFQHESVTAEVQTAPLISWASMPLVNRSTALSEQGGNLSVFSQSGPLVLNPPAENLLAAMSLPAAMAGQRDAHVTATPGLDGEDNVLVGGAGNDLIIGGQGRDILVGGFGSHDYDFRLAADSEVSANSAAGANDSAWLAMVDDGVWGEGSGATVAAQHGALDIVFSNMAETGAEWDGESASSS